MISRSIPCGPVCPLQKPPASAFAEQTALTAAEITAKIPIFGLVPANAVWRLIIKLTSIENIYCFKCLKG